MKVDKRELKKRPELLKGIKPTITRKQQNYHWSNIQLLLNDDDLYIRMTGSYAKIRWIMIRKYKRYTALDVIQDTDLGRHFEDAIYKLYKEKGLDFGYMTMKFKED